VNITVTPVNDPPVAEDDNAGTSVNTPITIAAATLLSNDTDVDGDELTLTAVGGAVGGTVALDNNGDVVFTPDQDFVGDATFEYTISDGHGETDIATVTVDVDSIPSADPQNAVLVSETGNSVTGSLRVDYGPDAPPPGGAMLVTPTEGNGLLNGFVVDDNGEWVRSNGSRLSYETDADGNLTAIVAEGDEQGTPVFTVTLDADAGTYTVSLVGDLDGGPSTFTVDTAVGGSRGGNQKDLVFQSPDGGLVIWASGIGNDGTQGTVNSSIQGLGVNDGNDIDIKNGQSEKLTIRLTTADGWQNLAGRKDVMPPSSPTFILAASLSVTIDSLKDGEEMAWMALRTNSDGSTVLVATGTLEGSGTGAAADQDLEIAPGTAFDTVEFMAVEGAYRLKTFVVTESELTVSGDDIPLTYNAEVTDSDGSEIITDFQVKFDGTGFVDGDIAGTSHDDVLAGGAGGDVMEGRGGDDFLDGRGGDDILIGGEGNDVLTGGAGKDVFLWRQGDEGTTDTPAVDTVKDFEVDLSHLDEPHDVLDLSDLLQNETPANIGDYLTLTFDVNSGHTTIDVHPGGAGSPLTQQIIVENVDLTAGGTVNLDTLIGDGVIKVDDIS
jgi:Ca2+-binding RTX toxin-like protein